MMKNKLFNKPAYKQTLKSLMMPSIIICIAGIAMAFIQHFLSMADETTLSISMKASLTCMFIGGFVLPIMVFNFLNEQKKSIYMLSLPVKRSGLYISKV